MQFNGLASHCLIPWLLVSILASKALVCKGGQFSQVPVIQDLIFTINWQYSTVNVPLIDCFRGKRIRQQFNIRCSYSVTWHPVSWPLWTSLLPSLLPTFFVAVTTDLQMLILGIQLYKVLLTVHVSHQYKHCKLETAMETNLPDHCSRKSSYQQKSQPFCSALPASLALGPSHPELCIDFKLMTPSSLRNVSLFF